MLPIWRTLAAGTLSSLRDARTKERKNWTTGEHPTWRRLLSHQEHPLKWWRSIHKKEGEESTKRYPYQNRLIHVFLRCRIQLLNNEKNCFRERWFYPYISTWLDIRTRKIGLAQNTWNQVLFLRSRSTTEFYLYLPDDGQYIIGEAWDRVWYCFHLISIRPTFALCTPIILPTVG